MDTITLSLNGVAVSGRKDETILELARKMGAHIPTLCHEECLKPMGACRVCLVEEQTSGRLLAACVTPISPGMQLQTDSPAVMETRKAVVKLLMANHPESCLVCDKGNHCQLRLLAANLGVGPIDYDRMPPRLETRDLNPFITRDLSKCILCAKCIRADHELVVVGALEYLHRGFDAHPATLFEAPLEKSECTFCGTCVAMCPTGALMEKNPEHRGATGARVASTCSYCGCGCGLWIHTREGQMVAVTPRREGTANQATLCVRGHYGSDYLNHPSRLRSALMRRDERLSPVEWEDALQAVIQGILDIVRRWGPKSVGFFGSGHCTNEENYLLQKIARKAVGTPHIDNGARLQAISSVMALDEVLGIGAASNPLYDLEAARVIFIIGAQPTESHPVAGYHIKRAVRYHRARLVYVSLFEDPLSMMAESWIRVQPSAELYLIAGIIHALIDEKLYRPELAEKHQGWKTFCDTGASFDPGYLEKAAQVDYGIMRDVARILASNRRCAVVFGTGFSQGSQAFHKIRLLAYMALLLGCLGVSGGGIFPLDKAANTQGACDMGSTPEWLPGYRRVDDPKARAEIARLWGDEPPAGPGWSLGEMLDAALRGELKALYVLGENPVSTLPPQARDALNRLDLLIVQDIFPSETAKTADVVLAGAGFAEKDGTYTSLERRIQRLRPVIKPPGSARADWWILAEILRRLGHGAEYDTAGDIMREITTIVPQYGGIQYSRLEPGGLFWPCEDVESMGEAILHRGGVEKVSFGWNGIEINTNTSVSDEAYPWLAVRGETHFHLPGGTRSGRSRRLAVMMPGSLAYLHPEDMVALQLADGDAIRLVSPHGDERTEVRGTPRVPSKVILLVPACEGTTLSNLWPWGWDVLTRMPEMHTIPVRIERSGGKR